MARSGIQANLNKMTRRIHKGMPILEALTAEWMQAVQELFWSLSEGENFKKGLNIRKRSGPGWCLLSGDPSSDDNSEDQRAPFEVFLSSTDGDSQDPTVNLKVAGDSWLMKSIASDDYQPITGLDSEFDINLGEKIWLSLAIDNTRKITKAKIAHGKAGGVEGGGTGWDNFPDPVQFDDKDDPNRIQTGYNQLLAYVDDMPQKGKQPIRQGTVLQLSGQPGILVQCVYDHLRTCEACDDRNGLTIVGVIPWYAPAVSNDDQQ